MSLRCCNSAAATHRLSNNPICSEQGCSFRLLFAFISIPLIPLPSPSPHPCFSKGETSQHPPAGWCFWNQERVLPVPWAVSIIGSTREASEGLKCAAFSHPPPSHPKKKRVHYYRPCAGLLFNAVINKCHVFVTHSVPQAGRCSIGSWIRAITRRGTPAMWCGRCWRLWLTSTPWKLSTEILKWVAALTPSEYTVCTQFPCWSDKPVFLCSWRIWCISIVWSTPRLSSATSSWLNLKMDSLKTPAGLQNISVNCLKMWRKKNLCEVCSKNTVKVETVPFAFSSRGGCKAEIRQTCGLLGYWCHYVYTVSTI